MPTKKCFIPGEPFKFSRTKIQLFTECQKCFYLDRVKGVSRPPSVPFSLNNAVDVLFKREFDYYRLLQQPHPLVIANNLDLIPFQDTRMEDWRNNFIGVKTNYKGYEYYGAVDDIWMDKAGTLYVIDYKATAKENAVTELGTANYHETYRRQIEFYQWLLVQNGFTVSPTGYFVYTTGDNSLQVFNDELKFRTHLIAYTGNYDWVTQTLEELISCLSSDKVPAANKDCVYCNYVAERNRI